MKKILTGLLTLALVGVAAGISSDSLIYSATAPNVTVDSEGLVTWTEVPGATGYDWNNLLDPTNSSNFKKVDGYICSGGKCSVNLNSKITETTGIKNICVRAMNGSSVLSDPGCVSKNVYSVTISRDADGDTYFTPMTIAGKQVRTANFIEGAVVEINAGNPTNSAYAFLKWEDLTTPDVDPLEWKSKSEYLSTYQHLYDEFNYITVDNITPGTGVTVRNGVATGTGNITLKDNSGMSVQTNTLFIYPMVSLDYEYSLDGGITYQNSTMGPNMPSNVTVLDWSTISDIIYIKFKETTIGDTKTFSSFLQSPSVIIDNKIDFIHDISPKTDTNVDSSEIVSSQNCTYTLNGYDFQSGISLYKYSITFTGANPTIGLRLNKKVNPIGNNIVALGGYYSGFLRWTPTIINGLQTTTVSGITIKYFLAPDGHKICPADQEEAWNNITTTKGSNEFYLMDEEGERFKSPVK